MSAPSARPLPRPAPESDHFWKGLAESKILIQRCRRCDQAYFPPRSFCPHCGSEDISVFEASGDATLYSFVISNHRVPGFERPYIVGIAELKEGPRLMTQIVGVQPTPEHIKVDMALEPVFQTVDGGQILLHFRPKSSKGAS